MAGGKHIALSMSLIMLTSAFLLIVNLESANGEEEFDCRLYLDGKNNGLNTIPPTPSPTEQGESLVKGQAVEYDIGYPVTDDMPISGPMDAGKTVVILHLYTGAVVPGSSGVVLSIELIEVKSSGSEEILGSTQIGQSGLDQSDLAIPISDDAPLSRGSILKLVLNVTEGEGYSQVHYGFSYGNAIVGEYSYLSFYSQPIPDDGINLVMTNPDGNEINEIMPNGPPETRTVNFNCGVKDLFGADDVASINLQIKSLEGSLLLNKTTEEPEPGGGQEWTYFNFTEELPESMPVGEYDVILTGVSHTGYTRSETYTLTTAEGLYVTIDGLSRIEVDAGDIAIFTMEILNGGGSTDRLSFSAQDTKGWSIQTPDDIDIEPGATTTTDFRITVPLRARIGEESNVTMKVTSRNAEKMYSISGGIYVKGEATFGIEAVGDNQRAVNPGMDADYQVRLTNLRNDTKVFEMSVEGLPSTITAVMKADNGVQEGSYYNVEVGPGNETLVTITLSVSSSEDGGTFEFIVNARPRGGSEERSVYYSVLVVDPSMEIISIPSGRTELIATRSGTAAPIKYNSVSFGLYLYNPTLQRTEFSIDVDIPDDWAMDLDNDAADLLPGTGTEFNLSITPADGQLYVDDDGFDVTVTVTGDGISTEILDLVVKIKEILDVKFILEKPDEIHKVEEGKKIRINMTLQNRGNTIMDLDFRIESPPELGVNITPASVNGLGPDDSEEVVAVVEVFEIDEDVLLPVKIKAYMDDYEKEVTFQVDAAKSDDSFKIDPVLLLVIGIVGIAVLIGSVFLYSKFASKKTREEPPVQTVKKPRVEVRSIGAEPVRTAKPLRSPTGRDIMKEADAVTMQLLGEDKTVEESVEVVEVSILE